MRELAGVTLVKDIVAEWPTGRDSGHQFIKQTLASRRPEHWGSTEHFPNGLTVQRMAATSDATSTSEP